MASIAIPNSGSVTQADNTASPNTLVLRDNLGGIVGVQVAGSELKTTGMLTLAVSPSKTTSFTVDTTAVLWLCNATGGAIVATLPPVAGLAGRTYWFKKTDASANNVTVTGSGAETIDGSNTKALTTQYAKSGLVCDGSQWSIIV